MRRSELTSHRELNAEDLKDAGYRAEWDRTQFAHEVAIKVIQYRVEHGLTQTQLAHKLGMRQPHIARLEAGDHEPSLVTLHRLARQLQISFHIDITPETVALTA